MTLKEIKINNLCPMIATISAGKTSLLNVFYDIDFLESSAGVGTKLINIIRYNPEVGNKPKLYHLIVKKEPNDSYKFYKDTKEEEIIGKEEIKKKIKEINDKNKQQEPPIENIFYMIEVGECNLIEDKEYLNNYDLVDVPGVSEYIKETDENEKPNPSKNDEEDIEAAMDAFNNPSNQVKHFDTIEKEMKNFDPKKEKSYITQIFPIIKSYMNNGIIVFSVDNYQHTENYRIIGKVQKTINKPIENFLLIMNKIDKSEDREYDLSTLNSKIMQYFPSGNIINFTKNIILPCSAFQLENELKMSKDFKYLFYFYFLNYLMNNNKDNASPTPMGTTAGLSFIDFLRKFIKKEKKKTFNEKMKKIIEDEKLPQILKKIKDIINFVEEKHKADNVNLGVKDYDFEIDEVKKIIEDLETEDNEEGEQDEEEFNINNQEGNSIILYFYHEFLYNKKSLPPRSKDTLDMINYFTMSNMKKNLDEIKKEENEKMKLNIMEEKKLNQKIDNISTRLSEFLVEYKNQGIKPENLAALRRYINSSIGVLKTSKYLYIPMLGVSNAGKSTILNGLVGTGILPTKRNECTKRGIIIKYWDQKIPVIRKTRFVKQKGLDEVNSQTNYFFETEEKPLTSDIKKIHQILEGVNGEFTDNEEDYFYEIDIKIKFIDDLNIDDTLKQKICFIDLPGFGTNNAFEKNEVYSNLMKSCNLFLFIVFNLKIKEKDNHRMLNNLYQTMSQYREIPCEAFIKKCLFVINCDTDQDTSQKSLIQAKNDIISVISGLNKNIINNINVCFFNAKFYENFVKLFQYYNSASELIENEYNGYLKLLEYLWRGINDSIKGRTFSKYLTDVLKEKIKKDIKTPFKEKEVVPDNDILKEIDDVINKYKFTFKKELVAKYITFGRKHINESEFFSKSYIRTFTSDLLLAINEAKNKGEIEINRGISMCFKILDNIFGVDPETKFGNCRDAPITTIIKPHVGEDLESMKKDSENYINSINKEFNDNNISSLLDASILNLKDVLTKQKGDISSNLKKKNWEAVQKEFENVFEQETKTLKNKLLSTLENASNNIRSNYLGCYNIFNKFCNLEIKPELNELKTYISNQLGENDIEKTIGQIINDIIRGSKTATDWENKSGFFDWLGSKLSSTNYLNKIIDYMIVNSTPKMKSFSDSIKNHVSNYKTKMIDELESTKGRIIREMENQQKEEDDKIKEQNLKNDEERKKWEEEKRLLEIKKKEWENMCKNYRILRDEITSLILNKEFTPGNK